jgi:predicted nucleotidyltransferase
MDELAHIKTKILAELRKHHELIRVAYLFGSQATGTAHPRSDVDVAVLLDSKADPLFDLKLADTLSATLGKPVDIVVLNQASPILQHEVVRDGVRLFEASAMERRLFELKAFRDYVDAVYFQQRRLMGVAHG